MDYVLVGAPLTNLQGLYRILYCTTTYSMRAELSMWLHMILVHYLYTQPLRARCGMTIGLYDIAIKYDMSEYEVIHV